MSIFDPNTFMETTYKGVIDTKFHSVPEGEYVAQCKDVKLREVTGEKIEGVAVLLELFWEPNDDTLAKNMSVDHVPQVRQSMWLDLVERNGQKIAQLDFGINKNMAIKHLMETFRLNDGNFKLGRLKFQTGYIKVSHRPNPEDAESPFAEVSRVTSLEKAKASKAA
jgi:hypothetical protein